MRNRRAAILIAAPIELVANGRFDDGITGWTRTSGTATFVAASGRAQLTALNSTLSRFSRGVTLIVGRRYRMTATIFAAGSVASFIAASVNSNLGSAVNTSSPLASNSDHSFTFTATAAAMFVGGCTNAPTPGQVVEFDNFSLKAI